MSNTFFTSDTHFCHGREFLYGPRGFTNAEEMNEAIIERWNSVVKPTDLVYHLGDTILNNNEVGICVPKVMSDISNSKILVMEYFFIFLKKQICITW